MPPRVAEVVGETIDDLAVDIGVDGVSTHVDDDVLLPTILKRIIRNVMPRTPSTFMVTETARHPVRKSRK